MGQTQGKLAIKKQREVKKQKMAETKTKKAKEETTLVRTIEATKGRIFKGTVTKVFLTRVVIELERTVYHQKYERYYKKKIRLHARIPKGLDIAVGDVIKVRETRPLSKIIHFAVIEIVTKVHRTESKSGGAKK